MQARLTLKNFYKHPRFWRHAIMWLASCLFIILIVFLSGVQAGEGEVAIADLENANKAGEPIHIFGTFLVQCIILVYASFYAYNICVPKRKYKTLTIAIIAIVVFMSVLDHYIRSLAIQLGETDGFLANLIVYPIIIFVAFGFKLGWHGVNQLFIIEKLKRKQAESELNLLKAQVNPHFLFNTLNNIYATNLNDQDKANEIILELSDLLRYQLETNKKHKTSLSEEIQSLHNYIALEKIRVKNCDIEISENGDFNSSEIVPLLLIPFVENAFKYGTGIERGDIKIALSLSNEGFFHFSITNKIVQKAEHIKSGGIGIENVKKRLEIMYKDKHEIEIKEGDKLFSVNLSVKL